MLAALRASGPVRYRVDVLGYQGDYPHSETVLRTRDARRLTATTTVERQGAEHAFRPVDLPEDVEVRKHRSMWQSAAEWV